MSNLRCGGGRPRKRREAEGEEGDGEEGDGEEGGGEESEDELAPTPAPRRTRHTTTPQTEQVQPKERSRVVCEFATAKVHGICGMVGCKGMPKSGCKACGLRLCWPKCVTAHVQGTGKEKVL